MKSTMLVLGTLAVCAGLVLGAFHVGQERQCRWHRAHHTTHVRQYCGK